MNIGICVQHSTKENVVDGLKKARENGFCECQLISWAPELWTDEEATKIKETSEEIGMKITAFWCGWRGPCFWNFYEGQETIGLVPQSYRWQRIQDLCDGADFAKKIGITDIVTHMGYIPENPYDPNYGGFIAAVKHIAKHLKANEQYLLFETGQETPVAMLRAFQDVGSDNLGVNFDTGNVILYGKANPVDAIDVIGKYIRNIHAKDGFYPTDGYSLGKQVKLGEGKADFPEFIKKLHSMGYDGPITIEREITGEQQLIDILETKKYIENIINNF